MTNFFGENLIDGDAGMDIRGGLFDSDASKEGAVRSSVIPCPIGTGFGVSMIEAAHDLEHAAGFLEWLQRFAEFKIRAFVAGPPGGRNRAIGKINKGSA